jgi:tetratricopeptide (TPR) repeat protein
LFKLNRLVFAVITTLAFLHLPGYARGQEALIASARAWFDKGMLYQEAGNAKAGDAFKQAIEDLDKYISGKEADPQRLPGAYVLRAKCRIFHGQGRQAIPDLDKAIELSPDDGDIYYLRSFVYRITGDADRFLEDLKTAARKGNEKAKGDLTAMGKQ